ncbi:MAG: ATP-binding cassette domain-containing protein [Candidatus Heimdallarchaeota archaeon]
MGAGKTTLLRTILGLLPTDNGKIYWNGKLVDEPSEFMIPPRSAYTPQVPFLFRIYDPTKIRIHPTSAFPL